MPLYQVEHNPWADGTWEPEALLEKASDMVLKAGGKWVYKSVYVLGFGFECATLPFDTEVDFGGRLIVYEVKEASASEVQGAEKKK